MTAASVKARLDVLEQRAGKEPAVRLDLSALPDADLEFIESVGAKCEPTSDGWPDLSKLSVDELRRLHDLLEGCPRES